MDKNRTIVRIKFGSHLYGTSTPASDTDYKSIFVPSARSIIMQTAQKTISTQRPKGIGEKNKSDDVDEEQFSVQRFLELASEGQTVALDVLFSPPSARVEKSTWEWAEIVKNRHRLLTKKSAAFVGYARSQANKFGIKGSRVASARAALAALDMALESHSAQQKLSIIAENITMMCAVYEHMQVDSDVLLNGQENFMWNVCNRKMPFNASIKNAREVMARIVDEYGRRAIMAENQQGVDWKALSHAVRVGGQAIELLKTGNITFPLPNASHIVAIKLGRLRYQDVAAEIEQLLVDVEAAAAASTLPDHADIEWINSFVERVHLDQVSIYHLGSALRKITDV